MHDTDFNFVLASLTYHGDLLKCPEVMKTVLPPNWSLEKGRKESVRLYDTFYNYSDANLG